MKVLNRPFLKPQCGITIVEIMVTLAVASVLIGLAMPAFNGLMAQRALRSQANDFILAVQLARSEATNRGLNVSVQAADASDDANEFGLGGWCVVTGNGGACPGGATELRTFGALNGNTMNGLADLATLTFNSRGLLLDNADRTLELCDTDENVDPGRTLSVTLIGRVSFEDLECHP